MNPYFGLDAAALVRERDVLIRAARTVSAEDRDDALREAERLEEASAYLPMPARVGEIEVEVEAVLSGGGYVATLCERASAVAGWEWAYAVAHFDGCGRFDGAVWVVDPLGPGTFAGPCSLTHPAYRYALGVADELVRERVEGDRYGAED